MKITITVKPDVEIPDHVYNEAVELFLSHVVKHYEELLLRGDNYPLTSKQKEIMNNTHKEVFHPLTVYGQSCPIYYKN